MERIFMKNGRMIKGKTWLDRSAPNA